MKAYKVLKAHATKSQSLRLAEMAAKLRTGGHFDSVIEEIDKMMATLKAEEKDDIDQRDWCKEETFKNEQEASRYEYKIEKTDGKIYKLQSKLAELEATRQATIAQIQETKADIQKMEDTRNEEHAAYETAKSDDEGAAKLLAAAIESMTAFYKNNKIEMGPIQGAAKALVQDGEPVFEVSADQAPDATFTSAGKSTGEAKGITSTLTMIKEDLEDEIKNGEKDDAETSALHDKELTEAKTLRQDLLNKKTDLEEAISQVNEEIDSHNEEKADREGDRDAEHEYLWSIKPDCTWILTTFDSRREKRDTEIAGLHEAIGMLQGALEESQAAGEPVALVQSRRQAFNDNSFGNIHLLHFQG